MEYVGIDLGSKECSATIIDEKGINKKQIIFRNEISGWIEFSNTISHNAKIALEASTLAYPIYDFLTQNGYDVKVAHPMGIRAIAISDTKTDKKDSEIIANLLRLNYLPLSYIPTKQILKNREILRTRIMIGKEIVRVKNRIHAFLAKNGIKSRFDKSSDIFGKNSFDKLKKLKFNDHRDSILNTMIMQLENLLKQKEVMQNEIAKLSVDNSQVKLLMSTTGIDYYLGMLIINEIGDITRFSNHYKLCKYAGLVPSVRQSSSTLLTGNITKSGPSILRWALSVAADVVIKYPNPLSDFYRKILRRTKSKKLAKTAVARKLLVMIYYMLKNNEPCRWNNKNLTERKIKNLQRICRKSALVA